MKRRPGDEELQLYMVQQNRSQVRPEPAPTPLPQPLERDLNVVLHHLDGNAQPDQSLEPPQNRAFGLVPDNRLKLLFLFDPSSNKDLDT